MAEQTWYVVLPFDSQESAMRALRTIADGDPGYLGMIRSAIEDDPPEYDPDGEGERVAEVFDQAATGYAREETQ